MLPPGWGGENPPDLSKETLPAIMTKQPTDGEDYNTYFYDPLVSFSEEEGGGRIVLLLLALVSRPLTTHPFRNGAPFLLLL